MAAITQDVNLNDKPMVVRVKAPATSANLGSGFDCIGVALDIWNELEIQEAQNFSLEILGEGSEILPVDGMNFVVVGFVAGRRLAASLQSLDVSFEDMNGILKAAVIPGCDRDLPSFHFKCSNSIPHSRGLGSSSAGIVCGILCGVIVGGWSVDKVSDLAAKNAMFNLACQIEGHPDNVGPAIYGGVQLAVQKDGVSYTRSATAATRSDNSAATEWPWVSYTVRWPPRLKCIVFIPCTTVKTEESRLVLPDTISRKDAVYNTGRTALLIAALVSERYDLLSIAMQDRLHQTYRKGLNPHMEDMIHTAISSGACAACLSGSGPSIAAWVVADSSTDILKVSQSMIEVGIQKRIEGSTVTLNVLPVDSAAFVLKTC